MRRISLAVLCMTALLAVPTMGAADPVTAERIIKADKEPENWLAHGRTYGENRFSPLKDINADNARNLGLAWYLDTGTDRGLQATPIVAEGVIYVSLSWSMVAAVDARTGKELWRFDPEVPGKWGANACCDVINRGVALWQDKVYVGTLDGRLIALDGKTGSKIWETLTIDPAKPYTITGAPRIVKGKVIIGNGGGEFGVRGYISAYDAENGKLAWRFYTVPGNPADPAEHPEMKEAMKTWSGEWWKYGGGGTAWDSMAYDPDLNLLYVGTGNGGPWSKKVRSDGKGDNLYLSSILAINPDTGRLAWHYQTTPGDQWDYTATQHMILTDLRVKGRKRQVLMQAPKNGFFYILDRRTGELLSAEKYVDVTWADRVDLKTGRPVVNAEAYYDDKPAIIKPSPLGGHNWQPMSYNPETGLVYIPANDLPFRYALEPEGFTYDPHNWNTATDQLTATKIIPREIASGALIAWDPVKQEARWSVPYPSAFNGGTLTTAGNLVFQGTADGRFVVYDARNGQELWSMPTQSGILAAPVTYKIDGKQFVAVLAGWGGIWGMLGSDAAASTGNNNRLVGGRLLVFALDGKSSLPEKPEPLPVPEALPVTADEATTARGDATYHLRCARCHGAGVISGGVLPELRHSEMVRDGDSFREILLNGALQPRGMPAFDHVLDEGEVEAIRQFILKQAWDEQHKEQKDQAQ